MADYLSDHTNMLKEDIEKFVESHLSEKVIIGEKKVNYRSTLKQQLISMESSNNNLHQLQPIVLNKSNDE